MHPLELSTEDFWGSVLVRHSGKRSASHWAPGQMAQNRTTAQDNATDRPRQTAQRTGPRVHLLRWGTAPIGRGPQGPPGGVGRGVEPDPPPPHTHTKAGTIDNCSRVFRSFRSKVRDNTSSALPPTHRGGPKGTGTDMPLASGRETGSQ